MKFNCTGCGVCCKRLKKILDFYKNIKPGSHQEHLRVMAMEFPYKTNRRGACVKLKNNRCSIYDSRPLLCNIKGIFEKYPQVAKTEEDWYILNMMACNSMMREEGIPPIFYLNKPFIQ